MLSPHNNPNLNHPLSPNASYGTNASKGISQPYSPPPSPTHTASTGTSPMPLAAGPEQTSDPNWQAFKNSVRERNAAMFNNELMSDVLFIVGQKGSSFSQQRIPAHKYVLATGSSVFYAMFFGGLAEEKNEIEIPDVEPSAFLTLLRYDSTQYHLCNITVIIKKNITFENATYFFKEESIE
jgi:BTB/POZ domain-containing protein 3/6